MANSVVKMFEAEGVPRALSLSILRREAYTKYVGDCQENGDEFLSFKAWCNKKGETLPPLKYWQTIYDMEMLLLRFVRSIHVGDLDHKKDIGWGCRLGFYS